jgi:hypothetical protein
MSLTARYHFRSPVWSHCCLPAEVPKLLPSLTYTITFDHESSLAAGVLQGPEEAMARLARRGSATFIFVIRTGERRKGADSDASEGFW